MVYVGAKVVVLVGVSDDAGEDGVSCGGEDCGVGSGDDTAEVGMEGGGGNDTGNHGTSRDDGRDSGVGPPGEETPDIGPEGFCGEFSVSIVLLRTLV